MDKLMKTIPTAKPKDILFIDCGWFNYSSLRWDNETKVKQVNNLYYTELCEPNNGIEHCFLPTRLLKRLEEQVENLYSKLRTVDTKVDVCGEVYFTSKIEGANTTIARTQQIHDGAEINPDNSFSEYMVLGGFNATKLLNLYSNRVSSEILREVWEVLTYGCCANLDIDGKLYRNGDVGVGNHMGLNPILIEEAMNIWIEFYNSDKLKNHPFIKAALLHYAFEFIHPYCDGNGRMGRLLMNNFLIKEGYEKIKAVSFSREIDKYRSEYDVAFKESENAYNDCTPFLEYMLLRMVEAFEHCLSS